MILILSSRDLLNVLGFKEGEEIDEEGNRSTYHLILEYIWQKVKNRLIYFTHPEFKRFNLSEEELNSYLDRLFEQEILIPAYRIDCPECDTPYKETKEAPLSMWGEVYKCSMCKSKNQILLEDILCYHKFNSEFKKSFHNFFFLQKFREKEVRNPLMLH